MGVFATPEPVVQTRATKLQEQLGWDSEQLKQKLIAPEFRAFHACTQFLQNARRRLNSDPSLGNVHPASSPSGLAPRWQLLSTLASEQAGFKAHSPGHFV
ncbi:TPA: hypothetical protein ACH3X1_012506 [Trebouxia sp. C0004]